MYKKSLLVVGGLVAITLILKGCGNSPLGSSGRVLPTLAGAKALSKHYVEVMFTETPGESAEAIDAYSITDSTGAKLSVTAAKIRDDGTRVLLTTAPQRAVEYVLSVNESGETGQSDALSSATASFAGSVTGEPYLSSAISLGPDSVLLTFSERMDAMVNLSHYYRIAAPDLDIIAASQVPDENMAILATEIQDNVEYTVKVTNVASDTRGILIDPTRSTASFHGIPPLDDVPPTLKTAICTSATNVLLSFSEPLDDEAADPNNFSIDRDVVIAGAELTAFNTQVLLTTLPLTAGIEPYEVTVTNANGKVRDLAHNALDPDPCIETFTFTGQPGMGDANSLPRVVGAISTDNTHVVVIFSKPMDDAAEDPSSYTMVQTNVNPEVGTLMIFGWQCNADSLTPGAPCEVDNDCPDGACENHDPRFVGADRTTVELTTSSQSELTYQVSVVNVRDQVGNPLGPVSMFADPTSATFAGTPPSGDMIDTDGDGLSDSEELRGWMVMVVLAGGETTMREVTSDPTLPDTDNDGLGDAQEKRRACDPRDVDTDDDLLDDNLEAGRLQSSPTHQDTDGDGIDDFNEVNVHQTSPILADTDGDGLDDYREVFELNRNPRIADLPKLQISVGDLALRIDERFVDQVTQAVVSESSSSTTLARSEQSQYSHSDSDSSQKFVEGGVSADLGYSGATGTVMFHPYLKAGGSWSDTSQTTKQSSQESQQVYQNSMSKAEQFAESVTREVVGASIDSYLTVQNVGDVAFTLSNLEISAMLPGRTRDKFVPIATMLPSSELITGDETTYNLAPFEQKGPIIISNREIYPSLVEDLMRNPRGLIFEVANYDITDEFGRNMAFQKEEVLGRTISVTIDPGDGTFQRYAVATNGAYGTFEGHCADGAICHNDDACDEGVCDFFFGGYDEHGMAIPLPLDYVLRDVLGLQKNADEPNAIVAGVNGRADTVAVGDDIQLVPIGSKGLNDRTIVVMAGENGVLDTFPSNVCDGDPVCQGDSIECCDDVEAFTTGYETSPTCNADTAATINEPLTDGDGIADTVAAGDDVQEVARGTLASAGEVIVSAGDNGILETVVAGDDEYRGPGEPCTNDSDCPDRDNWPNPGLCDAREVLVRFENSKTGDPNRFWVVMTSEDICQGPPEDCPFGIPAGSDFGDIPLRPTQAITLAFGQDIDRDGLFAREEFIYGSRDDMKDTDGDNLGDFTEIRVGWKVDVVGKFPEQVYPDARFKDSDFDGLEDFDEKECLTDPTKRDTDGDGIVDSIELGITTDLNGDGTYQDFERGFGRCCEDAAGVECASNPTLLCRVSPLARNGEFELPGNHPDGWDADGWDMSDMCNTECDNAVPHAYFRRKGGAGWNGEDGYFSLNDISAPWRGSRTWISQEILGLIPGAVYIVSGFYRSDASWSDCLGEPTFQVKVDDDTVFSGGQSEVTDWTHFEGEFTADTHTARLELRAEIDCANSYDVDGISVRIECSRDFPVCAPYAADLGGVCPPPDNPPYPPLRLDPRNPDTDGDTIEDQEELDLGLNPLDPYDADDYRDSDQDGLYDVEEMAGWDVSVYECDVPGCVPEFAQNGEFALNDEGWLVGDGNSDWLRRQGGPGWNGSPGYFSLNDTVGPDGVGFHTWISQEILGLTPGGVYVVSGYYRAPSAQYPDAFSVKIDTEEVFSPPEDHQEDVWLPFNGSFTATNVTAILELRAEIGHNSHYEVDGISIILENSDNPDFRRRVYHVYPNPLEGDSDFDGLPDYVERELRTDPLNDDTDGDGILDYDEFAEFGTYTNLMDLYPGFYLSGNNSLQLGTDPTSQDTDLDRLPDFFELTRGWRVLACTDDAPREVMSDPLWWDSDLDGLSDYREYIGANGLAPAQDGVDYDATDPTDPDTDGDGHLDMGESFPLGCGKVVTIEFIKYVVGASSSDSDQTGEFFFDLRIEHNEELEQIVRTDLEGVYRCGGNTNTTCSDDTECDDEDLDVLSDGDRCLSRLCHSNYRPARKYQTIEWPGGGMPTTVVMRPGDRILIYGSVSECDSGYTLTNICHWLPKMVTYEEASSGVFTLDTAQCFSTLTDHRIHVRLSITP